MVDKIQECLKHADYDGNTLKMEIAPFAPCSLTQAFLCEIIDLGLKQLKVKVQCQDIVLYSEPDKPSISKKDVKQKILVRVMDKGVLQVWQKLQSLKRS